MAAVDTRSAPPVDRRSPSQAIAIWGKRTMTRKHRRLWTVMICGIGLGSATALALIALRGNLVFFEAPSDLVGQTVRPGQTIRLGGLVEQNSLHRVTSEGRPAAHFRVTDEKASIEVTYVGILPDLFREGQGVVALGALQPNGTFNASEVLAKHDETYMPKEVADALKKSGRWNPTGGPPPPAASWDMTIPRQQAHG
jgi:cytochrome c-type biogenesis protein CcmE